MISLSGANAISKITRNAEIIGTQNIGQIKPGFKASIVVWNGDPFSLSSHPMLVIAEALHIKEHDVKSIRDAISETKCQSSINRFFTCPSWSLDNIKKRAEEIVFSNLCHDAKTVRSMEFVITWVRKKAKHGFVHYICDKLKHGTPIRSLLLATGKVDTVYA